MTLIFCRQANMIELLLEPVIEIVLWLVSMVVRAVVLSLGSLPYAAVAGILARDISPDAFVWQVTARVASILLIVMLAAVAVWPGVGSPAVWLACAGLGGVGFVCGSVAEYRHVRRAAEKPRAGSDSG